jgi:hypothetical protein
MHHLTVCICTLGLLEIASGQTKERPKTATSAISVPPVGSGAKLDPVSHSVTPLLSADTRRPDDNNGTLSPDDIRNTAKQRMLAQASPSFGTPSEPQPEVPRPEPKDYALNRIQFPAETPEQTPPPPTSNTEKLTKASLVFVSTAAGTRGSVPAESTARPALVERNWDFTLLPAGTRLVARLQTPVSSAVKTPVVAARRHNPKVLVQIRSPPKR